MLQLQKQHFRTKSFMFLRKSDCNENLVLINVFCLLENNDLRYLINDIITLTIT